MNIVYMIYRSLSSLTMLPKSIEVEHEKGFAQDSSDFVIVRSDPNFQLPGNTHGIRTQVSKRQSQQSLVNSCCYM